MTFLTGRICSQRMDSSRNEFSVNYRINFIIFGSGVSGEKTKPKNCLGIRMGEIVR